MLVCYLHISLPQLNPPSPKASDAKVWATIIGAPKHPECAEGFSDLPCDLRECGLSVWGCWWANTPKLPPTQPHYPGCRGASVALWYLKLACLWYSVELNPRNLLCVTYSQAEILLIAHEDTDIYFSPTHCASCVTQKAATTAYTPWWLKYLSVQINKRKGLLAQNSGPWENHLE